MTPSVPSEPSARPSRSGPAAVAGGWPSSSTPDGVARVRPATSSSKRPTPVEFCPAERVAAYPPRVANSQLCGRWPKVSPCAVERLLQRRPAHARAHGDQGRRDVERLRPTPSGRGRAATDGRSSGSTPASPPTTLVPPPKGTTTTPSSLQAREQGGGLLGGARAGRRRPGRRRRRPRGGAAGPGSSCRRPGAAATRGRCGRSPRRAARRTACGPRRAAGTAPAGCRRRRPAGWAAASSPARGSGTRRAAFGSVPPGRRRVRGGAGPAGPQPWIVSSGCSGTATVCRCLRRSDHGDRLAARDAVRRAPGARRSPTSPAPRSTSSSWAAG